MRKHTFLLQVQKLVAVNGRDKGFADLSTWDTEFAYLPNHKLFHLHLFLFKGDNKKSVNETQLSWQHVFATMC